MSVERNESKDNPSSSNEAGCEPSENSKLSFLLRPPIRREEVTAAAPHIQNLINEAYKVYRSDGVKGLRQFISDRKLDDTNNSATVENSNDSNDNNDAKISADPRPYQLAMANIAKKQNTIVQLNTGLGKTLIAIMTIRNLAHEFEDDSFVSERGHKKQTWFLVPSVALAVQQSNTLRVNLPYSISTVCHTAAKSDEARLNLSKSNILVLTHGSALELLQHYNDVFYFSRINLVVVDECHHATKKHTYTNIFEQFYHTLSPNESKPRVLGLTATPIINVNKNITEQGLEDKLVELETILDSKIVGFSSLGMSLEESGVLSTNRSEKSIFYENVPVSKIGYPNHEDIGLHKCRKKEFNQLQYLLEEYGPVVVWHYSTVLIKEISRNMYEKETDEQFAVVKDHLGKVSLYCRNITQSTGGKTDKLLELEKLLETLYGDGSDLKKASFDDTVGIVFVKQRISALSLKHYFNSKMQSKESLENDERKIIRSGLLTRKTTHVFKYLSSTQKLSSDVQNKALNEWLHTVQDMKQVLNSLRSREINLLFATSVVEEGVDIDACSFVIVLDELQTTKSYIQTRGRARQLDAKFYVFENTFKGSKRAPLSLSDASNIDSQVSTYLGSRKITSTKKLTSMSNVLGNSLFNIPDIKTNLSKTEEEAVVNGHYRVKHGMVDLQSSKSLVNRYCSCIPMDVHARSSRSAMKPYLPIYQNTTLLLPSHLPSNVRNISLPKAFQTNSKRTNESLLALIACVRLHENNVLNDRLLPLKRSDIQQKLQKSVLKSLKRISIEKYSISSNVDEWKQVFIYPIEQHGTIFDQNEEVLGCKRSLCIIAFGALTMTSEFSLNLAHNQLLQVDCSLGTCKTIKISESQWATCTKFYEALLNSRWRRRTGRQYFEYKDEISSVHTPFIVSCLSSNESLDWEHMDSVINDYARNDQQRKDSVKGWKGAKPRLVAPIYDPNNTYIATMVDEEKRCAAPFPDKDYSSYSDYFARRWACKVDGNSKLIQAQRAWELPSKMCSDIKSDSSTIRIQDGVYDPNKQCVGLVTVLLPEDACMETPLADPCLQLQSVLLPQILFEIERVETIHAFLRHCTRWSTLTKNLETISFKDVIVAMTAKSCTYDDTSYDRLEYLGDSVLKLIHTDALINSNNEDFRKWFHCLHEGDLSELRTAMGCNERLKDIAECAGFDNYILTTPLGRGTWLPFGLSSCHADKEVTIQSSQHKILPSPKVIADVVESLLGLIYLNCGYEATAKVAEELEISTIKSRNCLHQLNPPQISTLNQGLISKASEFLCVDSLTDRAFIMEACTHPTSTNLSNYQRLEWIGDAVLCLAAREWVYHNFPDFDVKDLVTIETILICNETLSLIAFNAGLHRFIIHCDSTLPGRLEAYEFQINHEKKGLWSSDPPKVLADSVEALIGVAHIDGGLNQGQKAATNVISTMLKAVEDHFTQTEDKAKLLMQLTHPIQALSEVCSSLKSRSCTTNDYYHRFKSPLWFGRSWEHCSEETTPHGNVGHIHFHDLSLCAIADKYSRSVAKLKASSLLHFVLSESDDDLKKKLEEMTQALD